MINFLQLNQNFQMDEWNNNILNDKILEELHEKMCSNQSFIILKKLIHKISTVYNKDKKHIINAYLNYVIRKNRVNLTPEFMNMLEHVIHSSNAVMDDILYYMSTIDIQSITVESSYNRIEETV